MLNKQTQDKALEIMDKTYSLVRDATPQDRIEIINRLVANMESNISLFQCTEQCMFLIGKKQ